jgi:hypothetical protein
VTKSAAGSWPAKSRQQRWRRTRSVFFLTPGHAQYLTLPDSLLQACSAIAVLPEEQLRFPWSGGTHPWLDAVVITATEIIGIESKRYEPFRDRKNVGFSDAYDRPVLGLRMGSFERLKDALKTGALAFNHLDATQLVKHAFGLRTVADKKNKRAKLIYLYAEPMEFPSGRSISDEEIAAHRGEVKEFASALSATDDVAFHSLTYGELLSDWDKSGVEQLRRHATALRCFDVVRK